MDSASDTGQATRVNGHGLVPARDLGPAIERVVGIGTDLAPGLGTDLAPDVGTAIAVDLDSVLAPEASPPDAIERMRHGLTLSVVIPTLNEADNIAAVLSQLRRFDDIVIVDGFSTDGTVDLVQQLRPDARVLRRPPRGKGDALRAGFAAASGDVIVIMDADGSMDPAEVEVFVSMIAVGFDLVKGSRLACGGGSHDLTFTRWAGNAALCKLANTLFRTAWTDLCYGYLAFRRSCLPRLALTADGFEIESQILGHAALAGLRIAEVPSVELPRLAGSSHLNARRDGIRVLRAMLAARFAPRAKRSAAALRPLPSYDLPLPSYDLPRPSCDLPREQAVR